MAVPVFATPVSDGLLDLFAFWAEHETDLDVERREKGLLNTSYFFGDWNLFRVKWRSSFLAASRYGKMIRGGVA